MTQFLQAEAEILKLETDINTRVHAPWTKFFIWNTAEVSNTPVISPEVKTQVDSGVLSTTPPEDN